VLVVATLGGDGALGQTSGGAVVRVAGVAVDVVDTIGAGDTFSAALLHALEAGNRLDIASLPHLTASDLEIALGFAVRASAMACTREGADPPSLADLTGIFPPTEASL
jgi:fructokinase